MFLLSFLFQHGLFHIPARGGGACAKACSFSPVAPLTAWPRIVITTYAGKENTLYFFATSVQHCSTVRKEMEIKEKWLDWTARHLKGYSSLSPEYGTKKSWNFYHQKSPKSNFSKNSKFHFEKWEKTNITMWKDCWIGFIWIAPQDFIQIEFWSYKTHQCRHNVLGCP